MGTLSKSLMRIVPVNMILLVDKIVFHGISINILLRVFFANMVGTSVEKLSNC